MTDEIDYAAEYDNSARVENSDELIDNFVSDAADFRGENADRSQLDIEYGPEVRNKLDIFWPEKTRECPIVMFIHGGYWQRLDRLAFSHMAKGLNEHDIAVAIPSYTLCPDTSIEGIINEMRRACIMLYQTYGRELTIVGHSAGGHLAACMMATDWPAIHADLPPDLVASGMGISGVYDLMPMLKTPINDALGLDAEAAQSSSPIRWVPDGLQQYDAWVGADESDEFRRQSKELAERWTLLGTPTRYVSAKGYNHFTVIHPLTDSDSTMVARILHLIGAPAIEPKLPKLSKKKIDAELEGLKKAASKKQSKEDAEPDEGEAADTEEPETTTEV